MLSLAPWQVTMAPGASASREVSCSLSGRWQLSSIEFPATAIADLPMAWTRPSSWPCLPLIPHSRAAYLGCSCRSLSTLSSSRSHPTRNDPPQPARH
jgi:hypothetical protein